MVFQADTSRNPTAMMVEPTTTSEQQTTQKVEFLITQLDSEVSSNAPGNTSVTQATVLGSSGLFE